MINSQNFFSNLKVASVSSLNSHPFPWQIPRRIGVIKYVMMNAIKIKNLIRNNLSQKQHLNPLISTHKNQKRANTSKYPQTRNR